VEDLEELNQSLRNRDKMKDDAIAQLSNQVMALTARMQEFERELQTATLISPSVEWYILTILIIFSNFSKFICHLIKQRGLPSRRSDEM
jgi:hypothetical protein